MPRMRCILLTTLAMLAFAGNSLLCRAALGSGRIDAASFTSIRIVSGALVLWWLARNRRGVASSGGHWISACALFAYAAGFSFAYVSLPAASGALLLFGAVQITMIGYGLRSGERLSGRQAAGLVLALSGLAGLLLPGVSAPPLLGAALMLGAGIAWGVYSLRGRGAGDPVRVTAGNFIRAAPITVLLSLAMHRSASADSIGITYAVLSGTLTSGVGYAIWYAALASLTSSQAATVQLSVPVIAAFGAVALLGEPLTLRLLLASIAILGGIALSIRKTRVEHSDACRPS